MWITRVSINNPVFAAMVMVAICVMGIFSYSKLGVEQMPDISLPGIWAQVEYPGATPEALEREVLKPLEEAINSVAGVKRITSRAFEGRADLSAEFNLDADMDRALQDVRDRVAAVQAGFPRDVKALQLARRAVTVGRRDEREGRVEVLQGLTPAATVLAARFDNLREGAKATVVAMKTAPVASAAASTPITR